MTGGIEASAARNRPVCKAGIAFVMAVVAAVGMPWHEASAVAIATSPGAAVTNGTMTGVNAPSANCAGAQVGNFVSAFWPNPGNGRTTGSGVVSCSDMSQFLSKPFPILNAADTAKVGAAILRAFPAGYAGQTRRQAGENFLYNRFVNGAGKVPAGTAMASASSPSGSVASASASQAAAGAVFRGTATAGYARVQREPINGLGVGIVNDPFDLSPAVTGTPGSVDVYIGDTTDPTDLLTLQASEPGDFATATYTLGIGDAIYLGLTIGIDNNTTSVASAEFDITAFDASNLGWSDQASFMNSLTADFTWNPATATLSELAPFLLNLNPLPITANDTILVYNYTAAAGAVPEPNTLFVLAVGVGSAAFWRRRQRR